MSLLLLATIAMAGDPNGSGTYTDDLAGLKIATNFAWTLVAAFLVFWFYGRKQVAQESALLHLVAVTTAAGLDRAIQRDAAIVATDVSRNIWLRQACASSPPLAVL